MIVLYVQIGTNHILPHSIVTVIMLIGHIITLLKEEWAQIGTNHTVKLIF